MNRRPDSFFSYERRAYTSAHLMPNASSGRVFPCPMTISGQFPVKSPYFCYNYNSFKKFAIRYAQEFIMSIVSDPTQQTPKQ